MTISSYRRSNGNAILGQSCEKKIRQKLYVIRNLAAPRASILARFCWFFDRITSIKSSGERFALGCATGCSMGHRCSSSVADSLKSSWKPWLGRSLGCVEDTLVGQLICALLFWAMAAFEYWHIKRHGFSSPFRWFDLILYSILGKWRQVLFWGLLGALFTFVGAWNLVVRILYGKSDDD
jgi:hypothetical protein